MTDRFTMTPYLTVRDAAAAIDFYTAAFGAQKVAAHETPGGKLMHAQLRFPNGALLMLSDDFPEHNEGRSHTPEAYGGSPVTLHLDVSDVDALWAQAVEAGATVTMPLADQFWGDRYGKLRDPFGHNWSLATPKRIVSEAEIAAGAEAHFPKHE